MKSRRQETDVLVVGAGPVGLMTALSLADKGRRVQIVDEEFRTAAHSYALALHADTLRLLDGVGVTADLLREGYRVKKVAFYHGPDRCRELDLASLGGPFPYLLALPQSSLESALEQKLWQRGVRVDWNHRVRTLEAGVGGAMAMIDRMTKAPCGYAVATTEWVVDETLLSDAAFVVGADGHRSIVCRSLDIEYELAGEMETYAVFEFHTDADMENEVRVVFHENTTNVLWPLPGGRCRWSFQRGRADTPLMSRLKRRLTVPIGDRAFPHLSGNALKLLIHERAPWFTSEVRQLDWSMEVRFERRLATRFGQDRCWLAGDAAHLTGPIAGQSLNRGLYEASDVAQRITSMPAGATSPDSLDAYNRESLAQWRLLLGVDGGLAPTESAPSWVKELCPRLLSCIPATGDDLVALAGQIGLEVRPT